MRITKSRLRQIIKEELESEVSSDDKSTLIEDIKLLVKRLQDPAAEPDVSKHIHKDFVSDLDSRLHLLGGDYDRKMELHNSFMMIQSRLRFLSKSAVGDDKTEIAEIISELDSLRKSVTGY